MKEALRYLDNAKEILRAIPIDTYIAGYYRGLIYDTQAVKDYLKSAKVTGIHFLFITK